MHSLILYTALALVSSQLVASAPPVYEERNVARDSPSWMQGNNPWAQYAGQHHSHQGQKPGGHPGGKPGNSIAGHHGKKGKPGNDGGKSKSPISFGSAQKPPTGNDGGKPTKKPDKNNPSAKLIGTGGGKAPPSNPVQPTKKPSGKHQPPEGSSKAQPSSGSGRSGGSNAGYQAEVIQCHNVHRVNHSAPALTWSSSLAATAQKIAETCTYGHSMGVDGGGYGQNIAAGVGPSSISNVISNMFYNHEEPYFNGQYGNPKPTGFEHWGHFSQVVWKKTSQVGCHTCDCASNGGLKNTDANIPPYFTVCNYKGPGNVAGQYAVNIGKPLGHPTVLV